MPAEIAVQIRRRTAEDIPWHTRFTVEIGLGTGLTRREQAILFNASRHCEVHKLLDGEMTFEYQLSGRASGQA